MTQLPATNLRSIRPSRTVFCKVSCMDCTWVADTHHETVTQQHRCPMCGCLGKLTIRRATPAEIEERQSNGASA